MSKILGLARAHAPVIAVVTLTLALLAPFASTLVAPRGQIFGLFVSGDAPAYYYFAHDFVARSLRSCEIPHWNPFALLGYPQLAEGQAAVFHPFTLLYLAFSTEIAMNWAIALSIVLTGLAFWSYLRALGLGPAAAWCGALVWALGGRMPGRIDAGHLNILVGYISWPLVLNAWERYRTTGRVLHLGVLALAYAALVVAGYPQFTFIFSLFFLCYVVLQMIVAASSKQRSKQCVLRDLKAIVVLGVFVLLGVGISAVQLLPTLDFVSRSARAVATYEFSTSMSLPAESLLTVLSPTFFGYTMSGPDQYWGVGLFWEVCLYIGILPLVAAVVGAFAAPREKRVALVGCALVFLVVAFGKYTPIYALVYNYLPLAGLFRGPNKYAEVTLFCTAALAGYGLQAMFDGFARRSLSERAEPGAGTSRPQFGWLRAAIATLLLLALVALGLLAYFLPGHAAVGSRWASFLQETQVHPDHPLPRLDDRQIEVISHTWSNAFRGLSRALLFLCGSALFVYVCWRPQWRRFAVPLAAVLLLADVGLSFSSILTRFDVELTRHPTPFANVFARHNYPPRVHDLTAGALAVGGEESCCTFANQGMSYGYANLFGYTGNRYQRYSDVFSSSREPSNSGPVANNSDWSNRIYRLQAVDYLIALESTVPRSANIAARHLGRILVPLKSGYSRARLLRDATKTSDPREALQYVADVHSQAVERPILETTDDLPEPAPLRQHETARISSFGNNRVEVDVTAAQPRVLMLAEMYDENWQATVNGMPAPVMAANYLSRAVRVPAGASHVVFEYVDPTFRLGAKISVVCLVATLSVLAISLWRRWATRKR